MLVVFMSCRVIFNEIKENFLLGSFIVYVFI